MASHRNRHLPEHADASIDVFKPRDDQKFKKDLASSVYHDVWKEFYAWELEHCQGLMAGLVKPVLRSLTTQEVSVVLPVGLEIEGHIDELEPCSLSSFVFGGSVSETICRDIIVEEYEPHPPYSSCTPIAKNTSQKKVGRRKILISQILPFVSYADDPGFDAEEFSQHFQTLLWQSEDHNKDPDLEMIQFEAVRRLYFHHGLSLVEINQLEFMHPLRVDNQTGLIWGVSQRDMLSWSGTLSVAENLTANYLCEAEDTRSRLDGLLSTFCPLIGCIQPSCPTHTDKYPYFESKKPTATNVALRLRGGTPCGKYCFKSVDDTFDDKVYWSDVVAIDNLKTILDILPDSNPCDLATICQKPCREIFVQRSRLFPDETIMDMVDMPKKRPQYLKFRDQDSRKFTFDFPCYHKGPCDRQSNCSCFKKGLHCQRSCRCAIDCYIRWKGCKCKGKECTPTHCPCYKGKRECDPDLCKSCGTRGETELQATPGASRSPCCGNQIIFRGMSQLMEVKRGSHGLGAFATRFVKNGEYLGEYLGEIVDDESLRPFEMVRKYLRLNYVYDLDSEKLLDAAHVGNETRYINHGGPNGNNCAPEVMTVDGEHRIGIFAAKDVAPREEFLLDYGQDYWKE